MLRGIETEVVGGLLLAVVLWLAGRARVAVAKRRTARATAAVRMTGAAFVPTHHIGTRLSSSDGWEGVQATGYASTRVSQSQARGLTPAAYARWGLRGAPPEPAAEARPASRWAVLRRRFRRKR
jgi:hypothetical protein